MIPEEIIKKIKLIDIRTKMLVEQMFSGEYQSVFRGRGIEFSEVREYSYGDDVRTIDWNVTARLGKPFVKVYEEERELSVILLLDISSSTLFGSQSLTKRDLMAELSALFSFSAAHNNDRVGAVLFSDCIEKYIPPRKEKTHALRILRELIYLQPKKTTTNLTVPIDFINNTQVRRSIVFFLSDFFGDGYEKPFKLMAKRHDVIPVVITDPMEIRILEGRGIFLLEDIETERVQYIDLSSIRVREAYHKRIIQNRAIWKKLFISCGLDYIELSTGEPYMKPMLEFFHKRARRL